MHVVIGKHGFNAAALALYALISIQWPSMSTFVGAFALFLYGLQIFDNLHAKYKKWRENKKNG